MSSGSASGTGAFRMVFENGTRLAWKSQANLVEAALCFLHVFLTRLPRELVEPPSLEVVKGHLTGVLRAKVSHLSRGRCLALAGS